MPESQPSGSSSRRITIYQYLSRPTWATQQDPVSKQQLQKKDLSYIFSFLVDGLKAGTRVTDTIQEYIMIVR
jgi:hypothetical protein